MPIKNQPMIFRRFSFLLSTLFVYAACTNSSGTIDLQNEKEVRNALTDKWEAEYMETRGSRIKIPESQVTQIDLQESGTYTVGVKEGIIKQNGEWGYNSKSHMLNMGKGSENWSLRILKLTGKELILSGYMTSNGVIMDSIVQTYKRL
jgi:hypothetical protein